MKDFSELVKREKITWYLFYFCTINLIILIINIFLFGSIELLYEYNRFISSLLFFNICNNIIIFIDLCIIIHIIGTGEFSPKKPLSDFFHIVIYANSCFYFIIFTSFLIVKIYNINNRGLNYVNSDYIFFLIYLIAFVFFYRTFRNVFLNKNTFPGGFHDAFPLFSVMTIVHGFLGGFTVFILLIV